MKAYEIIGCLNHIFSEFDRLAEDSGVEKIKTIGDNYMAVAGIPTPRANHARTATKLALDMISAAEKLRSRLPVPFSIRVGMHSGPSLPASSGRGGWLMTFGVTRLISLRESKPGVTQPGADID